MEWLSAYVQTEEQALKLGEIFLFFEWERSVLQNMQWPEDQT